MPNRRNDAPKGRKAAATRKSAQPHPSAESMPEGTVSQHKTEHESGYGGKKDKPKVSSDQRPGT